MTKTKKALVFEAVNETAHGSNIGWAVKTRVRKNGSWYTVCETFAVPGLGDAKKVAEMITEYLNDQEKDREYWDTQSNYSRSFLSIKKSSC